MCPDGPLTRTELTGSTTIMPLLGEEPVETVRVLGLGAGLFSMIIITCCSAALCYAGRQTPKRKTKSPWLFLFAATHHVVRARILIHPFCRAIARQPPSTASPFGSFSCRCCFSCWRRVRLSTPPTPQACLEIESAKIITVLGSGLTAWTACVWCRRSFMILICPGCRCVYLFLLLQMMRTSNTITTDGTCRSWRSCSFCFRSGRGTLETGMMMMEKKK